MAYLGNRMVHRAAAVVSLCLLCAVSVAYPRIAKSARVSTQTKKHRMHDMHAKIQKKPLVGVPRVERTLLAWAPLAEPFRWTLICPQGCTLIDFDNVTQRVTLESACITIEAPEGESDIILLNGKKLVKQQCILMPATGSLWVHGMWVAGPVLFVRDDKTVQLIQYCPPVSPVHFFAERFLVPDAQAAPYVQHSSFFSAYHPLIRVSDFQLSSTHRAKKNMRVDTLFQGLPSVSRQLSKSAELEQLELLEKNKELSQVSKEPQHMVRVLLDEQAEPVCWRLRFPDGFFLAQTKHGTKIAHAYPDVEIRSYGSRLFLNGQALTSQQCILRPAKDNFYFGGKQYQGLVLITRDHAGHWLLINCLDLEAYTEAVLGAESWPGWPLEVNKVFAIVSRTYAMSMIMSARANKRPYHIKNTNQHQMYKGVHTDAVLKEAVAQTKGVFIAYKRRPIIAMFDTCCGGVIPAYKTGVDFISAPYLARSYACTYCRGCRVYMWQATYTLAELEKLLLPEIGTGVRGFHDIRLNKKDAAGLVHNVLIKGKRSNVIVSGKKIYSLLKKIKSFCYTVHKDGSSIIFKGRGYGHHLGLCQWGAREMVRQGFSYPEIIAFYYPGTNLMRLP